MPPRPGVSQYGESLMAHDLHSNLNAAATNDYFPNWDTELYIDAL
jgi:hypothetical protein